MDSRTKKILRKADVSSKSILPIFSCSHRRRNVDDYMWVDEARKLLGFDGPEYKDRFATARRRDQGARTKPMRAGSAKNGAGMAEDTGGTRAHTSVSAKKAALREGRGPQEYVTSNSTKRSGTDDSRGGSRDSDNGQEVENIKKKRTLPKVEEKIHYKELLRKTLSERAGASTGKESGSRSDGLPGTKQGSHRLQSSIFTSASPHRLQKRIRNAPWMGAKVSDKSCDFVGASHHPRVSFRSVDAYLISC